VVRCANRMHRNAEVFVCDIFLNLFRRLRNAGKLCLCSFALECHVKGGVHSVEDDAGVMFVR